MKYFITYHAIERLKERFPNVYNKHELLKTWSKDKGTNCVKNLFDNWIEVAQENKSYLNNSVYMLKLYEKYGYDVEYAFLEHKEENILFILTKNRSESSYRLVTLMPTEFRPTIKNIKYNTKGTKEDKHNKFVMDFYNKLEERNKLLYRNAPLPLELTCTPELKEKFMELIANQQTEIIYRVSNSKAVHKVVIDDLAYEFLYIKTNSGNREITINKKSEISEEEKNKKILQEQMTPELKQILLKLVFDNKTTAVKISKTRSIHEVQLEGIHYEFLCHKTSTGDRNLILQKEPEPVSNRKKLKM